jgi:hypothetical protein
MTDALETLARELEDLLALYVRVMPRVPHRHDVEMLDRKSKVLLAAAAACRELSAQRSEGGYCAIRISDSKAATDAALAAFMEGR